MANSSKSIPGHVSKPSLEIRVDDLTGREIADFLDQHIEEMRSVTPPESKHALDLEELRSADVIFWSVRDAGKLAACGALKRLSEDFAELKSMRTSPACRGRGIASELLTHILAHAASGGYRRVYLETGAMPFFKPARELYRSFGFRYCGPFGSYTEDPNSVFMALDLAASHWPGPVY